MEFYDKSHLFPLLLLVVSGSKAGRITKQVQHWVDTQGMDWMIKRIKTISMIILTGQEDPRVKSHGGLLSGPFRPLHACARKNRRTKRLVLNILRFISRYSREPREQDIKEQAELISESPSPVPIAVAGLPKWKYRGSIPPYPYPILSQGIRFKWIGLYADLLEAGGTQSVSRMKYLRYPEGNIGKVHCLTKDGAYKLRFVYEPYEIVQLITWPLYCRLKQYAEHNCPRMFHDDVDAGKEAVRQLIVKHGIVWSIDLVSATDLVPADPQFDLMEQLFPEEKRAVSFLRRRYPFVHPNGTVFRHKIGQPMGLRCSFLMFSVYVYHIMESQVGSEFAQVGDDLVSVPCDVFHITGHYISEEKSIKGNIAEFCGTPIDSIGSYEVGKTHKDPLLYLQKFGKTPLYRRYPRSIAKRVESVSRLPKPYGLAKGIGILARMTYDQIEQFLAPPPIPLLRYSEDLRQQTRSMLSLINPDVTEVNERGYVYTPTEVHTIRISALNCVIEHFNAAGQVHPVVWGIYGLDPMTEEDLYRFPLTKSRVKRQYTDDPSMSGVHTMYNKVRKILVSATAAAAVGVAVAGCFLPSYYSRPTSISDFDRMWWEHSGILPVDERDCSVHVEALTQCEAQTEDRRLQLTYRRSDRVYSRIIESLSPRGRWKCFLLQDGTEDIGYECNVTNTK